jgi:hypothetical protein
MEELTTSKLNELLCNVNEQNAHFLSINSSNWIRTLKSVHFVG